MERWNVDAAGQVYIGCSPTNGSTKIQLILSTILLLDPVELISTSSGLYVSIEKLSASGSECLLADFECIAGSLCKKNDF